MTDLILYDGVCGLCNRVNQFVLARDRTDRYRFASLQGALAREILTRYGQDPDALSAVHVVADYQSGRERLLTGARAALHVLEGLGGPWKLVALLRPLPTALMDAVYGIIAARRYRWFGKSEACAIPPREHRLKFLDDSGT